MNVDWHDYPDRATARRAAARALHPDVGGDAAAFSGALAAIDAHFGAPRPIVVRRRRRSGLFRSLRSFPRRRRYIEL